MFTDPDLLDSIKENRFSEPGLCLIDQDIQDQHLTDLVVALKQNTHIKALDLSTNYISDAGAALLASIHNLEALNVSENNIGPKGAAILAKSNLKRLDISANPVGNAIREFAPSALIELIASECEITDDGAEALFSSGSIKKIDLSSNKITGTSLKQVASNLVLEDLKLAQNPLDPQSLQYCIANVCLVRLNLTSTFIGDIGASHLAQNLSLEELMLSQCAIQDAGAIALSKNKTLKKLILCKNRITNVGVNALASNLVLLHLDLDGNSFTNVDVVSLQKMYCSANNKVFTRTDEFLTGLAKKNIEEAHANKAAASKMSLPHFRLHGNVLQEQQEENPLQRVATDIITKIVEDESSLKFFMHATPEEREHCFKSIQSGVESRIKKQKVNPSA